MARRFRFAKTMPDNPHSYITEPDAGGPEFAAFAACIESGEVKHYRTYPYRYVSVDGGPP